MASYQHPTKISGYEVECIGTGTMGYVYKATNSNDGIGLIVRPPTFAFKTIRLDDKTRSEIGDFERRMAVDVRASQRLNHENVVRVDGIGEDENLRLKYIMMEYVEGKDLKQLTDSAFPPSFETVKSIILQLLSALQHVHEQHVIHRDIKPANVMFTRSGKLKLVDFGVALIDEPNDETRSAPEIVGSPDYMAPEQMKTGLVDGRADLYSTGALLYELLTRKRAFQGYNRDRMPPPTGLNRAFRHPVDAVIYKALAKDPNKRYQSAKEFQVALECAGRLNHRQALYVSLAVVGSAGIIYAINSIRDKDDPPEQSITQGECERRIGNRLATILAGQKTRDSKVVRRSNENAIPDKGSMGIVSGPKELTYFPMGQDVVEFAAKKGLKLFVIETGGTEDNIKQIAGPTNAGVGFVQADILLYIALTGSNLQDKVGSLWLLQSLYREEVQILVQRDFVKRKVAVGAKTYFDFLKGSTVLTDASSTGSYVTAVNLFRLKGETAPKIDNTNKTTTAVCKVVTGAADALIVTAGAPASLLKAVEGLGKEHYSKLELLPITDSPNDVYTHITIPAGSYNWLNEDVPTLAVQSLMMAYNFKPTEPYGRMRCQQIKQLSKLLTTDLAGLQSMPGSHVKWKIIEPKAEVYGWKNIGC